MCFRLRFSIVDNDVQFTLGVNPRADEPNDVIAQDLEASVIPRITELMSLSHKTMTAKLEERLSTQNDLSECTKATGELTDIVATLTSQNAKVCLRQADQKQS